MNNNVKKFGFTLIEMIGVITLLAIILIITLPNLTNTLQKNKEKDYQNYLNDLYIAAENFVVVNPKLFPELEYDNSTVFINLSELIEKGYVEDIKKNPQTKKNIDPNSTIKVSRGNDKMLSFKYFEENISLKAYVQSNLMLQYDSYTRPLMQNGDLIWPDLTGNNNNGLFQTKNFNEGYNNNKVTVNVKNKWVKNSTLKNFLTNTSTYTIEIIYKTINYAENSAGILQSDGNKVLIANRIYGHHYLDAMSNNLVRSMVTNQENTANSWPSATNSDIAMLNSLTNLGVTNENMGDNIKFQYFVNGNTLTTSADVGKYIANTDLIIGTDYDSTFWSNAEIYAVRLYNKKLTSDEIKQNYNIDKERFAF